MLLLLLFVWGRPNLVQSYSRLGALLVMVITLAFPHFEPMLVLPGVILLGLSSALVMLKLGSLLRASSEPFLSAALGLMTGNILLLLLLQLDWNPSVLAVMLALPLTVLLRSGAEPGPGNAKGLIKYLPFIFVFYVISGLRYDMIQASPVLPLLPAGSDLAGYLLAIVAAYFLLLRDPDLTLVLGIFFGMFSLSLGVFHSGPTVDISLFCLQVSVGFVDLFILGLLLEQSNWLKAFGLGIAVMCAGIAVGEALTGVLRDANKAVTTVGYGALSVSVLLLYLLARSDRFRPDPAPALQVLADDTERDHARHDFFNNLPPGAKARLSEREMSVLEQVVRGSNYKSIAHRLDISESSVKTYMRRVYEKLGVNGRQELLDKLFSC
jgi:DNA-binding CsgD family transcriptional regulator